MGAMFDQRVYSLDPSGLGELASTVAGRLESIPELQVNLRADRRLRYDVVEPVMDALARAGGLAGRREGVRVNLVIQTEEAGDA